MARMSAGKSKKSTVQKGGVTKVTKLSAQSKKNTGMQAEQNGSAANGVSDKEDSSEPVSLMGSQEHDGSVSDVPMLGQASEDMNADGKTISDPDSAHHHRIAKQAFMLFQENGCQHGRDWADWFEAERQVTQTGQSSRDE